jgi:hypothetical protein
VVWTYAGDTFAALEVAEPCGKFMYGCCPGELRQVIRLLGVEASKAGREAFKVRVQEPTTRTNTLKASTKIAVAVLLAKELLGSIGFDVGYCGQKVHEDGWVGGMLCTKDFGAHLTEGTIVTNENISVLNGTVLELEFERVLG